MLDFRNQNLRGRSFRNQDLTDADFSDADLRGVDFRGTKLIRIKFYGTRIGKSFGNSAILLLVSFVFGFFSGISSVFSNLILISAANGFGEQFSIPNKESVIALLFFAYGLSLTTCLFISLKKQTWKPVWGYFLVLIAATLAGALILMLAAMVAILTAVVGLAAFVGVGAAMLVILGVSLVEGTNAAVIIAITTNLLAWYLSYRCIRYEESMLLPLRRLTLKWHCWGGTQFAGATLLETDFRGTDLKHARFSGCKFIRCHFHDTLNLHLANTLNTALEPLAVRQLVLEGKTPVRDFNFYNLRGMVFAGLDFQSCNFYHADLSEADLRGCNLTDCNFSEAMALGTLFDNAIFTGAIIDNWSIDKTTQFNSADCRFVYLKKDKTERNPPQGEFKVGDFAKLYQEIANTVDFIAHTPAELQALLRAIEKIKADGGEIFIQQMERKADSVILRVQSEGDVEIDKSAIYAEVQQQKDIELLAIRQEYEQKLLSQQHELDKEKIRNEAKTEQVDLLAGLLKEAIHKPTVINSGDIGELNMSNNSRSISGATIQNSAVSLGDNSTVSNNIQQLPDNQGELKDVLTQLVALLEKSQLAGNDKQKIEQEIVSLTEIATKPADERKSAGGKAVSTLKDLTSIFNDLPEIAVKYGELIAKLVLLF